MELYGIVKFSSSLLCSKESLGQSIDVSIGGHIGTLTLPSFPELSKKDAHFPALLAPVEASTWKRGDNKIFWGKPISYPSGESKVEKALLKFIVPPESKEKIAQDVYDEFDNWINSLNQFITILTTQNSWKTIESSTVSGRLELIESNDETFRHIENNNPIPITIFCNRVDTSLHLNHLKEACRLASLKRVPRLEYSMLLEAYQARRNSDYRKAIIEAAAALEICLTERILQEFANQDILFGDKLIKRFRMLGGRFELIKILGIELPDKDYTKLILNPRNEVMHKASFPDAKTANQLISEVEKLLTLLSSEISQVSQE